MGSSTLCGVIHSKYNIEMAINKKLIHFKTKTNFENELNNGNILDTSICFIKDTKEIWTHGQFYNCNEVDLSQFATKEELEEIKNDLYGSTEMDTGNAVLVNKTTLEKISVKPDDLNNYSPDEWEPIGVVVIPSSHDVYGTGECGVMALMSASLTTPDTGQTENVSITWGAYGTDYPELPNYHHVVRMGTFGDSISDSIDGLSIQGLMPVMRNGMASKFECPHDTKAKYYNNAVSYSGYVPSPYLNNGSRNHDYYTIDPPSSIDNALSDFAGKSNTDFLCSKAISQPDWKIDETITNNTSNTAGYHPAACCCWRFHTPGTNQGDWYLPACGELGYIAPRYDMINDTISTIQTYFAKTLCHLDATYYWSSSEDDGYFAQSICFSNGYVLKNYRYGTEYVRPFTRLNLSKEPKFYTKLEIDNKFATKEEITLNTSLYNNNIDFYCDNKYETDSKGALTSNGLLNVFLDYKNNKINLTVYYNENPSYKIVVKDGKISIGGPLEDGLIVTIYGLDYTMYLNYVKYIDSNNNIIYDPANWDINTKVIY